MPSFSPHSLACDLQEVSLGQIGGCGLGLTKVNGIDPYVDSAEKGLLLRWKSLNLSQRRGTTPRSI